MEPSQDQRLSQLLQTQQERTLTTAEQSELELMVRHEWISAGWHPPKDN